MRNRLTVILLALVVLAAAAVAATMRQVLWPHYERIYQHETSAGPDAYDAGADVFSSHLPLVLIDTGGAAISRETQLPVTVTVIDQPGGYNHTTDAPALTNAALINIRGKTSAEFPKKQFRINFIKKLTSDNHVNRAVMGMPADTDWVLNGPYLDKSLMRNYLMYNLAGEIMAWAPHAKFCEVFINGNYEGLYVMTEAVTVGGNRVNVTTKKGAKGAVGYLLQRDMYVYIKSHIKTYSDYLGKTTYDLGIEFPQADDLTEENVLYILNDVNAFEEKLYALQDGDKSRAYVDEIDMNSFVDYFIFNEFTMNRDAGAFSTFCYRDPRGKLTMGPVWDFNNCLDNHIDPTAYDTFFMSGANWFNVLVLDHTFVNTVVYRYRELRKTVLSEERLLTMIDDIAAYLGPAAQRNFTRWDRVLQKDLLTPAADGADRNVHSFEEAVAQLKNEIILKGRYMDENLESYLRGLSATPTPKPTSTPTAPPVLLPTAIPPAPSP